MKKAFQLLFVVAFLISANQSFAGRMYNPQLGIWMQVDPADEYHSPYTYVGNNPINNIDPDGTSTITDKSGNVVDVFNDNDLGVYQEVASGGLMYMGETLIWNSFINMELWDKNEQIVPMGMIDFKSTWAATRIIRSIYEIMPTKEEDFYFKYSPEAYGLGRYNIKMHSPGGQYFGSQLSKGIYVSARDAGNILAGKVALLSGLSYKDAMSGFGAFNQGGNSPLRGLYHLFRNNQSNLKYFGEGSVSHWMQDYGYNKFMK